MGRTTSVVFALSALAASVASAAPKPPAQPPVAEGTLSVCAASGTRTVTGTFTYTFAAPASAGGTQTVTVAVGACSTPTFYPVGTQVAVLEAVPSGDAVTAITLAGASTLAATPAAGSATVTVGSGASSVTFATSGPLVAAQPANCQVPNVLGLGLLSAKAVLRRHACTTGVLRRKYSYAFTAGHVITELPRRGTVLAHNAPVNLVVSLGPQPSR
jgi:hypothetical protein